MFTKDYALGASIIGLLQVIDSILALMKIEYVQPLQSLFFCVVLIWVLISIIAVFQFIRRKERLLSPILFLVYICIMLVMFYYGFGISDYMSGATTEQLRALPWPIKNWFMLEGFIELIFGIFYAIINVLFFRRLINTSNPKS